MALHPQALALLERTRTASNTPWTDGGIERARAMMAQVARFPTPREPVARIENLQVVGPDASIPVRLYYPRKAGPGPWPGLIYTHGGGWIMGDLEMSDGPLRTLANRAGCVIVSVNYRLAPEHKFPAALDDTYRVALWLVEQHVRLNLDPRRLAVAGDSAGGNLAAALALQARDRGDFQPLLQLLIYPALGVDFATASYQEYGDGYGLSTEDSRWFWRQYLGPAQDYLNPYAVPLASPNLRGVCPAIIVTSECDPLRSDAEQYASRLESDGVVVQFRKHGELLHGFLQMGSFVEPVKRAIEEIATQLNQALQLSLA